MKVNEKTLNLVLGTAFTAAIGVAGVAHAADTPFSMQNLAEGYRLAAADKAGEGKCGAAKRGENPEGSAKGAKAMDGKCGEGKCGGKPKAKEEKSSEGKCGNKK